MKGEEKVLYEKERERERWEVEEREREVGGRRKKKQEGS